MNNTTEILEEVKTALADLCTTQKWTLTKSEDPFNLFDILYQDRGNGVCIVNYDGDSVHQQVCTSVVSKMRFSIAVSTRRDLTSPFDFKLSRKDGKLSLLEMVEAVKILILGATLSNGLSDSRPKYEGTNPLTTPEGVPLDAYKVSFWVYISNEPTAPETSGQLMTETI